MKEEAMNLKERHVEVYGRFWSQERKRRTFVILIFKKRWKDKLIIRWRFNQRPGISRTTKKNIRSQFNSFKTVTKKEKVGEFRRETFMFGCTVYWRYN